MTQPSNYNDIGMSIKVDPTAMYNYANTDVRNAADALAGSISRIGGIWEGLRLGWVGTTADEAQDFSDQWNAAVTGLLGTGDGSTGALPKIGGAVVAASINYGDAEDTNQKMFQSLSSAMSAPPGAPQPPSRGQNEGPVTENNSPS